MLFFVALSKELNSTKKNGACPREEEERCSAYRKSRSFGPDGGVELHMNIHIHDRIKTAVVCVFVFL